MILCENVTVLIEGVRPNKASGTQWIAHKIRTMTQILDKFGL